MWWTRLISALFVASLAFGAVGCKKEETKKEAPAAGETEGAGETAPEGGG